MKKTERRFLVVILMTAVISTGLLGKGVYSHDEIVTRLKTLSRDHKELCSLSVIGKTPGNQEVYVIAIGKGDRDNKPGIAVLGGIDGRYVHTRDLALSLAESLLAKSGEPGIDKLLSEVTFYIFPEVSPDEAAGYFSKPVYESRINFTDTDDDRDFVSGEDPAEDLNNDGLITFVRIEDPDGEWIESPDDPRVMIKADPSLGQQGKYIVAVEGYDNDKDGSFNEDGRGGVSFNSNFTFNFEEFGLNTGPHAVSEPEVRAVADFLFDHFNIYMTLALGPQDNLLTPWKVSPRPMQRGKTPDGIMKDDEPLFRFASDLWKEKSNIKGESRISPCPGNFAEWAYYDYGRYSFSTPVWSLKAVKGEEPAITLLKGGNEKELFVPWSPVSSDNFDGRKAEVGGLKPFTLNVPPDSLADGLKSTLFDFVVSLSSHHPDVVIDSPVVEKLSDNLWRLTVKVRNRGLFATTPAIGERNRFVRRAQIAIVTSAGQEIVSGQARTAMPVLEGGGSAEYSWLITGKGMVTVNAGAINCGLATIKTELK